MGQGRVTTFTK